MAAIQPRSGITDVAIYPHEEGYILTKGSSGGSTWNKQVHQMIASNLIRSLHSKVNIIKVRPWIKRWCYPISPGNVGNNQWTWKRAWWKKEITLNHNLTTIKFYIAKRLSLHSKGGFGTKGRVFLSHHPGGGSCCRCRGSRWCSRSVQLSRSLFCP